MLTNYIQIAHQSSKGVVLLILSTTLLLFGVMSLFGKKPYIKLGFIIKNLTNKLTSLLHNKK